MRQYNYNFCWDLCVLMKQTFIYILIQIFSRFRFLGRSPENYQEKCLEMYVPKCILKFLINFIAKTEEFLWDFFSENSLILSGAFKPSSKSRRIFLHFRMEWNIANFIAIFEFTYYCSPFVPILENMFHLSKFHCRKIHCCLSRDLRFSKYINLLNNFAVWS